MQRICLNPLPETRYKFCNLCLSVLFFCFLAPQLSSAQYTVRSGDVSQTGYHHITDTLAGFWREAGNPAGLAEAGLSRFGLMQATGLYSGGKLHGVGEPESKAGAFFRARGSQNIGKWMLLGDVLLAQINHGDVSYRSHAPVLTHNPYQWVDTTGGHWSNMNIRIKSATSSPLLLERFRIGFSAEYEVMQGARQNVERPMYTCNRYRFGTGLAIDLNRSAKLGVSGTFQGKMEEQELGFFNQLDTYVLILRGIETFNQTSFNSASRTYAENALGGSIQLLVRRSERNIVSYLSLTSSSEKVTTGISNPVPSGTWNSLHIESGLTMHQIRENKSRESGLKVAWLGGEGIDPQLNGVNVTLDHIQTRAFYKTDWFGSSGHLRHSAELGVAYDLYDMQDIVSVSERILTRLTFEANVARHSPANLAGLGITYYIPVENKLMARPANDAARRIFIPDYQLWENHISTIALSYGRFFGVGTSRLGITADTFFSMNPADGFSTNTTQSGFSLSLTLALQ